MKYLKTLFLFLLTALAPTAWGARYLNVYTVARGVEREDKSIYLGPLYADNTMMLEGEKIKIIFAEVVTANNDPKTLFNVDKFGEISLTSLGEEVIKGYETIDYTLNSNGTFGEKDTLGEAFYKNNVWIATLGASSMPETGRVDVYLLRFDSRVYNSETEALEIDAREVVHAWGATTLYSFRPLMGPSMGKPEVILDFKYLEPYEDAYEYAENPTPSIPTILPQSLVVGEETLSGTALETYLAPAVEGLASNEDGFTLTGSSNDVLTYTLQTKASLDDEWDNFDAVLADLSENEKKVLESSSEKCYTYLRVKKSTQIKIPRLPNETQRFYRLKAE